MHESFGDTVGASGKVGVLVGREVGRREVGGAVTTGIGVGGSVVGGGRDGAGLISREVFVGDIPHTIISLQQSLFATHAASQKHLPGVRPTHLPTHESRESVGGGGGREVAVVEVAGVAVVPLLATIVGEGAFTMGVGTGVTKTVGREVGGGDVGAKVEETAGVGKTCEVSTAGELELLPTVPSIPHTGKISTQQSLVNLHRSSHQHSPVNAPHVPTQLCVGFAGVIVLVVGIAAVGDVDVIMAVGGLLVTHTLL